MAGAERIAAPDQDGQAAEGSDGLLYEYKGRIYPEHLKSGNACRFIAPFAREFCRGHGVDVGCGNWPLDGAIPVDLLNGHDALRLPEGPFDYVFSSHCLEHVREPVKALERWRERLKPGGVLFLYLPHPEMEYWLPQNNRKHVQIWWPKDIVKLVSDLGFENVIHSERDLNWSFAVVGFKP